MDLSRVPDSLLTPVAAILEELARAVPVITREPVMLIGAQCRDILHAALGHDFKTVATRDLDIAISLEGWDAFDEISRRFRSLGTSGVRFQVAGLSVDVVPFGKVERPRGVSHPPGRLEGLGVWALEEVYAEAASIDLVGSPVVRLPSVSGYAATKIGAWLDRSEWYEEKDAGDLALAAYWYSESEEIEERLYGTSRGSGVLVAEELDVARAAARLLGRDVVDLVGAARTRELRSRWTLRSDRLSQGFVVRGRSSWSADERRQSELVAALSRGLMGGEG